MKQQTPQSRCGFGLAHAEITPPAGIYHRMWGAATHERATGIHRPLQATTLVFRPLEGEPSADNEQIIVALDHCLLWAPEMQDLLARVSKSSGGGPERVTVAFSHTHAAGLMDRSRSHLPGGELIGPYLIQLADMLAQLIQKARASVAPVTILYTLAPAVGLSSQRDFWDTERGLFVCGHNPGGAVEDHARIAAVHDEAGRLRATVVQYACHPTTLAFENTLISPDFPGAMRELVEGATGAPCVFLQGAAGDVGPREGFVGDTGVADRNGRILGYRVLSALETLPPPGTCYSYQGPVLSGATLGIWKHVPLSEAEQRQRATWHCERFTVPLPYRAELPTLESAHRDHQHWLEQEQLAQARNDLDTARDAHAMVERLTRWLTRLETLPPGDTFPLPVTLWRMGDAIWLAVEGEHYQFLQNELAAACAPAFLMLITLANGARCTYLPTRESYGKGIYQESIAVLAPGCLEELVRVLGERIVGVMGQQM